MSPQEKLSSVGLTLPSVAAPIGVYVPALRVGEMVYTSGQLPFRDGKVAWTGKAPTDVPLDSAKEAARQSALNGLAAIASVCGGLDAIDRIIRVCVYVNSAPGFTEQPKVANGASELLGELFGENGRHARSAVGVNELPMNSVVEVELVVKLR